MSESRLAPGVLLAAPTLVDTFFEGAVVLLLEANHEGAMGFIVNQPMELTLGEVGRAMDFEVHPSYHADVVYGGGPVTPELGWVIAKRGRSTPLGLEIAMELEPDIMLLTEVDSLRRLLATPDQEFRLILGYAGWGPEQLQAELREGTWVTQDYADDVIFDASPAGLWQRLLHAVGLPEGLLWGKPVRDA